MSDSNASNAIILTYDEVLFISVCIVSLILALTLLGIYLLYRTTYPSIKDIRDIDREQFELRFKIDGAHNNSRTVRAYDRHRFDSIRYVFDVQSNFWASYLQAMISVLIVGLVIVLLILKIINAEAGLPVIATIGGAAIGKRIPNAQAPVQPSELTEPLSDPER